MSEKVVKLEPVTVGDDYFIRPDQILDEAKGMIPTDLVVIGMDENGEMYIAGSKHRARSVFMIEQAKLLLLQGNE